MLLGVEKIKSCIAALVNPEAFHSAFPRHDVNADSIRQIKHRIVSFRVVQEAAGIASLPKRSIGDPVTKKNDSARRIVLP
jgi:hypothetical protein